MAKPKNEQNMRFIRNRLGPEEMALVKRGIKNKQNAPLVAHFVRRVRGAEVSDKAIARLMDEVRQEQIAAPKVKLEKSKAGCLTPLQRYWRKAGYGVEKK